MIKTAQLRVYVPFDSGFAPSWPTAADVWCRPAEGPYGILGESMTDDVLETDWRGRRYVCPRTPLLRVLEGVLAIRHAYRRIGDATVIPAEVALAAHRQLEDLRRSDPDLRSHILSSAWHVPVRWFVAFDPYAKEVIGVDGRTTVRYRVGHVEACERLRRARAILSGLPSFEAVAGEIGELESWIAGFPSDSLVELDYGGISAMFSEVELVMDDSVGDVWAALDALARGDHSGAEVWRERIGARWAGPASVGYSS